MARKKLIDGRLLTAPIVLRSKAGHDYCKFEVEFKSELYECLCFDPEHFPTGKIQGDYWKGIVRYGGKDSDGCWYVERTMGQQVAAQREVVVVEEPKGLIEDLMNDLGASYVTKILREELNDFGKDIPSSISRVGFRERYKMAVARLEYERQNARDQKGGQGERGENSENMERDF